MGAFADVIAVISEGQLNYRDSIKKSDTSNIVINMIPNEGNVTDADGNEYQSVRIGNQVWTVENLKTTRYNDSTPIPHVTESGISSGTTGWRNLTTGAYCYYDNNSENKAKYGALYNWRAVKTGKLAPKGWRVPTDADWDTLQIFLIANKYNHDSSTSGNKIAKSMASRTEWASYDTPGTIGKDPGKNNASGFSALPGGYRSSNGFYFHFQSNTGYWWCAPVDDDSRSWFRFLENHRERLDKSYFDEGCGFSVRLLRTIESSGVETTEGNSAQPPVE